MAVVSILESKTSKSARIMVLLIFIVYWLFVGHLHFKAVHISYVHNAIADSLSRGQFQKFRELAPTAELKPMMILEKCTKILKIHLKILEKKVNLYLNLNLSHIWPPPITHITNCIHHMSTDKYSCATISSYISFINLSNKMHEHVVDTQSFVFQKLLAVVSKTNK